MKYIVVYIILILVISSLKTEAQKPSIELLPSASTGNHPQSMIDTCTAHDSLFMIDSIAPLPEAKEKTVSGKGFTWYHSPALRRRTIKAVTLQKSGLFPLFIKKSNPINFIIYFTALKF